LEILGHNMPWDEMGLNNLAIPSGSQTG